MYVCMKECISLYKYNIYTHISTHIQIIYIYTYIHIGMCVQLGPEHFAVRCRGAWLIGKG